MSFWHKLAAKAAVPLAIAALVAVTAASPLRPAAAAEKLKFILAHPMPTEHIIHEVSVRFMDKLKELSKGEYTVEYHPGGDLGGLEALFDQAKKGVLPMVITFPVGSFDPRLDVAYLGYIVDNWNDAKKLYSPDGAMVEVYNDILKDLDMVSLGTVPTGFGAIVVRKGLGKAPVNFPEDAKGVKLRTPLMPIAKTRYSALGFSPVPIPFAEVYTALQLGTVDARSFSPIAEAWQMHDVLEAHVRTNDYFEQAVWFVGKKWWGNRSAEERKIITEAVQYALAPSWEIVQKLEAGFEKKLRDAGVKIVDLSPQQMEKAKKLVRDAEWPEMEKLLGPALMGKIKKAAGVM